MKLRFNIILAGLVAISFGLVLVVLSLLPSGVSTVGGSKSQDSKLTPTPTVSLDGLEDVPVFTDEQDVKVEGPLPREWRGLIYSSDAPAEEIVAFYKAHISPQKWTFDYENRNAPDSISLSYIWMDEQDATPYDLMLFIDVYDARPTSPLAWVLHSQAHVHLSITRVPVLSKTPMYPGATAVQTRDNKVPTGYKEGFIIEKVTSFVTSATPAQVIGYYKDRMVQYGWEDFGELRPGGEGELIPGSVEFAYNFGGAESGRYGGSVVVYTKQGNDGQTEVELHIRGHTNLRH